MTPEQRKQLREQAMTDALIRRAKLPPEVGAKVQQVEEGIGKLLAHTHAIPDPTHPGRVNLIIDNEVIEDLTFFGRKTP